jgi:hypothetical protein
MLVADDDFGPKSVLQHVIRRVYANHHYAGHPSATIKQFHELWQEKGLPELSKPPKAKQENSLFPD